MKWFRGVISYIVVSVIALVGAFYFASAVMSLGQAQPSKKPTKKQVVQVTAPAAPLAPEVLMKDTGVPSPIQQTAESVDSGDYDVTGMRDPFKPYKGFRPGEGKPLAPGKLVQAESVDPLQNLELGTVEVVAVLWDVREPRALVRTAAGVLHTVRRNTKIGRNDGVVVGIREGEVIVSESFEEDGKVFKQFTSLKMTYPSDKKSAQAPVAVTPSTPEGMPPIAPSILMPPMQQPPTTQPMIQQ